MASCTEDRATELKIFQFNIWQEGTMIEGGFESIIKEIIRSDADFVTLSEVRNYNGSRFCDRIVEALSEHGLEYHSFYSYDSGLLSRYPIIESATIFPEKNDQGSIYKLVADVDGTKVSVYTAHLDYRNCAYYDVKGYNGSTWSQQEPVLSIDTVLMLNRKSMRDDAIACLIKDANIDRDKGHVIIIGGDFNEPSHLDWIENAKNLFDRQGLIIPWDVSMMLEKEGYKDTYRELFPNPATHPGVTYPADCPEKELRELTWAPEADERERIDFIHYYPDSRLTLKESIIVGPSKEIVRSQRVESISQDLFLAPVTVWPTDHKGLISTFILK